MRALTPSRFRGEYGIPWMRPRQTCGRLFFCVRFRAAPTRWQNPWKHSSNIRLCSQEFWLNIVVRSWMYSLSVKRNVLMVFVSFNSVTSFSAQKNAFNTLVKAKMR